MTAAAAAGPMGLIAGSGSLPVAIAEGVRRHGRPVICINVFDADPALERLAETSYTVALGELGGVIVAVEAAEGTDSMIRRAGPRSGHRGRES